MASVDRDASRKKTPWVCRWRDEAGIQRKKGFARKVDADRFRAQVEHTTATGSYIDPTAGKQTFMAYAEQYRKAQPHRPNTAARWKSQLTKHVYPVLGNRPLAAVRRTEVQAFITGLSTKMAPSSAKVILATVKTIFGAAVRDRLIAHDPCNQIKLPDAPKEKVVPLTVEQVEVLAEVIAPRYRAAVVVCAGVGLRQGECFGLKPADVDFLRKTIRVERQIQPAEGGGTEVCPPKNKYSYRTIPVADVVLSEISAHMREFHRAGDEWLFCSPGGQALSRTSFNDQVWRKAREAAAVRFRDLAAKEADKKQAAEMSRLAAQLIECGQHDLRHFFASALIRGGLNPKVVAERMGHADAAMTLNVYSHLWPDDEDRTRQAIEDVFKHDQPADVPSMRPSKEA